MISSIANQAGIMTALQVGGDIIYISLELDEVGDVHPPFGMSPLSERVQTAKYVPQIRDV